MVEEMLLKMARVPTLKGSWPWPWIGSLHTSMHQSSTSTYIPHFIEINETLVDVQTDEQTFETHIIRSTQKSRPKNQAHLWQTDRQTDKITTAYTVLLCSSTVLHSKCKNKMSTLLILHHQPLLFQGAGILFVSADLKQKLSPKHTNRTRNW